MFTVASYMPIFGKKRKEMERRVRLASDWEMRAVALDREVTRLRRYIHEEMSWHFESYNGGLIRQIQAMQEMRLPTPWVPVGIKSIEDPVPDHIPYDTITYVRESRMVPITKAGRI